MLWTAHQVLRQSVCWTHQSLHQSVCWTHQSLHLHIRKACTHQCDLLIRACTTHQSGSKGLTQLCCKKASAKLLLQDNCCKTTAARKLLQNYCCKKTGMKCDHAPVDSPALQTTCSAAKPVDSPVLQTMCSAAESPQTTCITAKGALQLLCHVAYSPLKSPTHGGPPSKSITTTKHHCRGNLMWNLQQRGDVRQATHACLHAACSLVSAGGFAITLMHVQNAAQFSRQATSSVRCCCDVTTVIQTYSHTKKKNRATTRQTVLQHATKWQGGQTGTDVLPTVMPPNTARGAHFIGDCPKESRGACSTRTP